MSDKILQLPEAQTPLGDKLDGELLTVGGILVVRQRIQIAGDGEGDTDIVEGAGGAMAITQYGLGIRSIPSRSALQTFASAVLLDDSPIQDLSALEFDCGPYSKAILYLDIVAAGNPQALNVAFEFADVFSTPGATDWHIDLENRVRIQDFSEQRRSIVLPASGQLVRTRLDAEGTTASDTITVTITAEFFTE